MARVRLERHVRDRGRIVAVARQVDRVDAVAASSGVTLSQHQPPCQAPWTRTKSAIGATLTDQPSSVAV
jgi:hypothetical protein